MIDHLKKSENVIMGLIYSDLGVRYSLACKVNDIKELPVNEFYTIQKMLSNGQAIIRMAPVSIDGTTFNIISRPSEKWLSAFYSFVMILAPVIGIVFSFIFSWHWLLLAIIAPIVSMRFKKRAYLQAIINRAFNSEIIFSYLFTASKITIELPGHGILYRILPENINQSRS